MCDDFFDLNFEYVFEQCIWLYYQDTLTKHVVIERGRNL